MSSYYSYNILTGITFTGLPEVRSTTPLSALLPYQRSAWTKPWAGSGFYVAPSDKWIHEHTGPGIPSDSYLFYNEEDWIKFRYQVENPAMKKTWFDLDRISGFEGLLLSSTDIDRNFVLQNVNVVFRIWLWYRRMLTNHKSVLRYFVYVKSLYMPCELTCLTEKIFRINILLKRFVDFRLRSIVILITSS